METISPSYPIPLTKPSITSLKHYSTYDSFKKYHNKKLPKPPLQLQSFMSQLISDNPIVYNIVEKQDMDHFERLKKLNELHCLDLIGGSEIGQIENTTGLFDEKKGSCSKKIKQRRPFSSLSTHKSCKTLIVHNKYQDDDKSQNLKQVNGSKSQYQYYHMKSTNNPVKNSYSRQIQNVSRSKNIKLRRSDILANIQKRSKLCLQKFIEQNQKKQIFEYVDELIKQLQGKSREEIAMLSQKVNIFSLEKSALSKQILELKYKICCLERIQKQNTNKISQLTFQNHNLEINYELLSKFSKDFQAIQSFQPGMNCRELIAHYIKMEQLCLNKLQSNDSSQAKSHQHTILKYKEQISSLKLIYNIVCNNLTSANSELKQLRSIRKLDDDNTRKLNQTTQSLKLLQNRIVQFYNSWYQNREKTIKGILKQIGCFKKDYSYFEMIEYMEMDLKNLSTSCKVDEYLRRILATIQLAQRKVFPNVAPESRIDPCKIVNDIVGYTLAMKVTAEKRRERDNQNGNEKQKEKSRKGKGGNKENQDAKYITQV